MIKVPEVFANFRISIDNGFRNEFSYVHYRRWGIVETWEGGRYSGKRPERQRSDDCIEIWMNWNLLETHKSYRTARTKVDELLKSSPVNLGEFLTYLELDDR